MASEFSKVPGGRARDEGPFSGEQFLDELLRPGFTQALGQEATILVDLDGTFGYATSFLESSFGGLSREYDAETVLKVLRFKSDEEPYLIDEIRQYIREAAEK